MISNSNDTVLCIEGLCKSFSNLKAVDNLTFSIRRGEIFGFLGPNGAGKTTTIHMLCGLLKRDAGTISFSRDAGEKGAGAAPLIGLCPQNLVIWESLTCLEQVEFVGRLYDLPRKEARASAGELLERLGLEEKRHQLAKTLSGGMKRRLNIALALVHHPQILILDEPQAGLDPQSRVLVRDFIRSLSGSTTVILTTHEMDEADRLSDRVAIIDQGKLLELDTPRHLKNRIGEGDVLEISIADRSENGWNDLLPKLPPSIRLLDTRQDTLRFVGTEIPSVLPMLMAMFQDRQVRIEDMTIRKKTLEDVFISLTGRRLRE